VVLCCAADDAAELAQVVLALKAQGTTVELVADAATNAKALEPVVARFEGEGIYVLCRSEGLTRDAIDGLREILLAHRVPFGRTLTVASIRAQELLDRIGRALRRIGGAGLGTGQDAAPAKPVRKTMLGISVPAPRSEPAAPSAVAPDDSVPTDVGTGHEDTVTDATSSREDTVAGASAIADPPAARKPPGPIEFDELTTIEVPHSWIDEEERAHTEDESSAPQRSATSRAPPPPPPARSAAEDSLANAPLITAEDLADLAADSGPIDIGSTGARAQPFRSPSKVLITGDTVIARLVGDAGHTPPSALPRTAPTPPSTAPTPPSTAPAPVAAPALGEPAVAMASSSPSRSGGRTAMWIVVCGVAIVGMLALGWGFLRERGETTSTASTDRTAPPEDTQPPPAEDGDIEPEESLPDATLPGQLETAVMVALRNRELRALDVLLVANEDGPALAYADAETYCRTFEVAGLLDWRLPEVGELVSMTEAGMVGAAIYWSKTPADTFGDSRLAWHGRLKRVLQRDAASRTLCVRGEYAAP
jgi:hypothetical protein